MHRLLSFLLASCILVNSQTHAMFDLNENKALPINDDNMNMIKNILLEKQKIILRIRGQKISFERTSKISDDLDIRVTDNDFLPIINYLNDTTTLSITVNQADQFLIDQNLIDEINKKNWQTLTFNGNVTVAKDAFASIKTWDSKKSFFFDLSRLNFTIRKAENTEKLPRIDIYSTEESENLSNLIDSFDDHVSFSLRLAPLKKITICESLISKIATRNWQTLKIAGKFHFDAHKISILNRYSPSTDIIIDEYEWSLIRKSPTEFSRFKCNVPAKKCLPDLLLAAAKSNNLNEILISSAQCYRLEEILKPFKSDSIFVPRSYESYFSDLGILNNFSDLNFTDAASVKIVRKNFKDQRSTSNNN